MQSTSKFKRQHSAKCLSHRPFSRESITHCPWVIRTSSWPTYPSLLKSSLFTRRVCSPFPMARPQTRGLSQQHRMWQRRRAKKFKFLWNRDSSPHYEKCVQRVLRWTWTTKETTSPWRSRSTTKTWSRRLPTTSASMPTTTYLIRASTTLTKRWKMNCTFFNLRSSRNLQNQRLTLTSVFP